MAELDAVSATRAGQPESAYPQPITVADHVEPVARRIRAMLGGRMVLDTMRALYLWEWPFYPQYLIPAADVDPAVLVEAPGTHRLKRGTVTPYVSIRTLCEASPYRGITTQSMDMAYVFDENVLDYGALLEARSLAQAALEPVSSDRVWSTLPMGEETWLTFVQAPWWCGASTVVHEGQFDARERLDLIRELEVTILCQMPEEYAAQIALPDVDRFRLPRLRRCVAIGDLEPEISRRWRERFDVQPVSVSAAPAPQEISAEARSAS